MMQPGGNPLFAMLSGDGAQAPPYGGVVPPDAAMSPDMMQELQDYLAQMGGADGQPDGPESELDLWARQNYGVDADHLGEEGLDKLAAFIQDAAKELRDHWAPNRQRIKDDARERALYAPKGATGYDHASGKDAKDMQAAGIQQIILPDPWILVDKLIAMLSGAGHTIRMPSLGINDISASQNAESQLMWWRNTWVKRSRYTKAGDAIRQLFDHALMEGVMCVLTMPDSSDQTFPWDFRVVPFHEVYPEWDHKGICRVVRQYDVTVAEARRDNLLRGMNREQKKFLYDSAYKPKDTIKVVSWYDHKYNAILIEDALVGGRQTALGTVSRLVKPPVQHGVMDTDGNPKVPWIIVAPLGDLSVGLDDDATVMYGPSVLFGVHDIYHETERAASMFLTNMAKDIDPATVDYTMDGQEAPPIDRSVSATNTRRVGERVETLGTAANPMNVQPYMAILKERLDKLTLSDAMWGMALSGSSGYQVRLLQSVAKQKLLPYIVSFTAVMEMILQRAAEVHYHILSNTVRPLRIATPVPGNSRTVTGKTFDSSFLEKLGGEVQVKFGEVMPEDRAAIMSYVIQGVQAGVFSRYSAMDELGIQDPMAEFKRIARESVLMNPTFGQLVGPMAQEMSDDEFFTSVMNYMMQMQAQAQQAAGQPGGQGAPASQAGPMPTQALPLQMQAGPGGSAGQAPQQQGNPDQQRRAMLAQLMAQAGGSQPVG